MTQLLPQAIGLLTAWTYGISIISARRGLQYSNASTVTLLSLISQTVILWTMVGGFTGLPDVGRGFLLAAITVGFLMPVLRWLTYTGIAKIGAARGTALRSTHPLFSALLAVTFLGETAATPLLTGIVLVVLGIVLISWREEQRVSTARWWHGAYSLSAAFTAAVVHNIARASLLPAAYPVLFAAIVGAVSLVIFAGYLTVAGTPHRPVWDRRAMRPFLAAAVLETLGFLLFNTALSVGPVVIVTPMVATQPMWVLVFTVVFLRNIEMVTLRTVSGSLAVVAGTLAITLGGALK
ncbi:MAG: DMT family transporter [Deltaproteobacteria bacterium]|nr:DMT family transporter [Deltaproteobacteria bacterium]